MSALADAVLALARTLPSGQREKLVEVLNAGDEPTGTTRHKALEISAGTDFAGMVAKLFRRWENEPTVTSAGLALAIRTAGEACDNERARTIRPVWTGPDAGKPVRLTASVMAEVIAGASKRLLVLSFAAYKVPQVLDGLKAAAARGVTVDIVLETADDSGGALAFDQVPKFAGLEGVRVWHWPADRRPAAGGSLHAKAIVADGEVALVTSANLTGHALANNIELGLLVQDRSAALGIESHVDGLRQQGVLTRLAP